MGGDCQAASWKDGQQREEPLELYSEAEGKDKNVSSDRSGAKSYDLLHKALSGGARCCVLFLKPQVCTKQGLTLSSCGVHPTAFCFPLSHGTGRVLAWQGHAPPHPPPALHPIAQVQLSHQPLIRLK